MSAVPLELVVALIVAVAALIMGLVKAYEAIREGRAKVAKMDGARRSQVDRLRRAARNSLNYKQLVRDARRHRDAAELEVEEAQAKLTAAEAVDHRLYVLDDRRTKADQDWVAMVFHPDYAMVVHSALPTALASWRAGRRYLVFALDPDKAREKIMARYPERLGYAVTTLEPRKPVKFTAAGITPPAR